MAVEREVDLKLGASLKPGAGESLKQLSRIMDELGGKTKPTFAALNEALEKSNKLARQVELALRGVGKAGAQDLGKLVEDAKKATAEVERLQKTLAKAGAAPKAAPGLFGRIAGSPLGQAAGVVGQAGGHVASSLTGGLGGLSGIGGMAPPLAAATVALAGFAASVKAATYANELHYKSLQLNPETGRAEENKAAKEIERSRDNRESSGLRDLWGLAPHLFGRKPQYSGEEHYRRGGMGTTQAAYAKYITEGGPSQSWLQPEANSLLGRLKRKLTPDSVLKAAEAARRREMSEEQFKVSLGTSGLDRDIAAHQAQQSIGIASQQGTAENMRLSRTGALNMEQARMAAQGKQAIDLRKSEYGIMSGAAWARTGAIANTRAVSGYGREQQLEDTMRQIAAREQSLKIGAEGRSKQEIIDAQLGESHRQEQQRQGRFGQAKKEEAGAYRAVQTARSQNLPGQEVLRLADLATAATEKRKAAEESLMQAQQQSLELQKAGHENLLQTMKQQADVQKAQLQTIQQQREAEQKRKQGLKENLGLMNPNTLRTMLHVSRKVKAGQAVTQNELEFMKGHGDVFGSQLQQIGAGMAAKGPNAAMIQELMQNTNQDKREKALDKQSLQLQNQMNFQVNIDANSVSDSLLKKVTPQINNALKQIEHNVKAEMDRILHQAWQQNKGKFGGSF